MSEVWNVANQTAWLIGWIVQGMLAVAAYFAIGLKVAKSVQLFKVASAEARFVLAAIWPLVVCGKLLLWFMRTAASLLARLYVLAVEAASGEHALAVPAGERLAAPPKHKPRRGPYRSDESDGERLKHLYAERQHIDRQIAEIHDRLAGKKTPQAAAN